MTRMIFSQWFIKRLAGLMIMTVAFACLLSAVLDTAGAGNGGSPDWGAPKAMAIKRVSQITGVQSEPNFLNNLDCSLVTYRMVAGSATQTGCFTETAFGLIDSDSDTVIFNGTDEGLPLLPYSAHQVLVPWPKAGDLVMLDPVNTGGTYISLYKNPLATIHDQRNILGQLTAKQLTGPADLNLKDPSGNRLVINPQSLAFSDGGSWLVAETLGGSFVRVNLATLSTTSFAPAYGSQGSPALLKSRLAVSDDGRFVAISNDAAGEFKVYDLGTCDGTINGLVPQGCRSHDYRVFVGEQIAGLRSIGHVRFIQDGLLSFEANSANQANTGIYEIAPTDTITSLTGYIGLGDSYTSGEGAFDYLADTDSSVNSCHLSRNSYPLLLAHDLFGNSSGHSVACSGAIINDVGSLNDSYRGQVKNALTLQQLRESQPLLLESVETNFVPGYVAQQRFVKRWQPEVTTVSVGGDDIGFGDILQNCVEPHISRHISDGTCYNTYEDRLELMRLVDRTVPRWTALYNQLKREAPDMRSYAIGYPQIAYDKGSCALNVVLNKSELEFAAEMVDYLNSGIKKAAEVAGVPYVDMSQALVGHRLCETASYNVAVNGLTTGNDVGLFGIGLLGHESYHPNALGQSLMEQAILRQTHNLSGGGAAGDAVGGASSLLNAPKSGRKVNLLIPDSNLTTRTAMRGARVELAASGARDGLKPGGGYVVHLDGPDGPIIGKLTSGANGDINGAVIIPPDIIPGGHTIDVNGESQDGEAVDVTQPIYVPAGDVDTDGDGIDNIIDSCPAAINTGHDEDHDGTDDICDNLISQPPATGNSGGNVKGTLGMGGKTGGYSGGSVKSGANSRVLGAATVKPSRPRTPTASANNNPAPDIFFPSSRIIYWLPWLFLLLAALVLLAAERYTQSERFPLQ